MCLLAPAADDDELPTKGAKSTLLRAPPPLPSELLAACASWFLSKEALLRSLRKNALSSATAALRLSLLPEH